MSVKSYQELDVWQRAMDLTEKSYLLTSSFPKDELYGMTSQIRRYVASVPANIAEGWARHNQNEFAHFLRITHGSLRELEIHLLLSVRIKLCNNDSALPLLEDITIISKQLVSLLRHIKGENHA